MGFSYGNKCAVRYDVVGQECGSGLAGSGGITGRATLQRTLEQRLNERQQAAEQKETPASPDRTGKRIFKALVGVAVVAVFGYLPIRALWQTSSVEAVVNSRLVTLRAPIDGQVVSTTNLASERHAVDQGTQVLRIVNTRGDRVRLDDLRRQRAKLENERPSLAAKLASAQAAQKDLARQAAQFREGRMRQLEARLAENEAAIGVAVARKEEAMAAVERAASLTRSGTLSTVELARLTREQTIAQQNEHAARRRLDATQIELAGAREGTFLGDSYNDRPSSVQREEEMRQRIDTLRADLAQIDAEVGWLSSEIGAEEFRFANQSEAQVKLPVTGRVWEIMTAAGEDVRAGQPLARILDCSSAVVTANVTERVYNRLQIGQTALFRPADGSQDVKGTIVNLTGAAGAAANLAISPDALSKEPYRVTVSVPRVAAEAQQGRTHGARHLRGRVSPGRQMIDAVSPGLIAFGVCLAIIPWLRWDSTAARSTMAVISVLLLLYYWWWRVTHTVPPVGLTADFVVGILFLMVETAALFAGALSLLFLSRTKQRSAEVDANRNWIEPRAPLVDVFICTYNEEAAILERTIIGATGMRYPNYRVWVLDDGRRNWLQQLAERLGCHYLTRSDNAHAKAGNINHALRYVAALPEQPEFISILDADFVTTPDFLTRAMALFHDETVGVVQTPQHFINADPIQVNLATTDVWPDEQRFFFDIVMPAKDAWGAAFCCGTSSVIRFSALAEIGGFPTDSVTEDYLVTLRLKEIGSRTVYLNERLTIGWDPLESTCRHASLSIL